MGDDRDAVLGVPFSTVPMQFADREDAGRRLAKRLSHYAGKPDTLVVALPRGGVVVGREVADALRLALDIVVPRKIGSPGDPEYAIGAVTETGEPVWNERERERADPSYIDAAVGRELAEARRRLETYRAGFPPRLFRGITVIVVDDGVATGYTMRAALATVKRERPAAVIVAVPVCPPDSRAVLEAEADEVVVLETPKMFGAIGAYYENFPQVDDATVIKLLRRQ